MAPKCNSHQKLDERSVVFKSLCSILHVKKANIYHDVKNENKPKEKFSINHNGL